MISEKIKLKRDEVTIFMGSMNAMPMMYALELKKSGHEIIYFVDASKKNTLCRPENHFPTIDYPYPPWIVEFVLPSQILIAIFPRLFALIYRWHISRITKKKIGCFVLNGFFVSLAPYLNSTSKKIGLSHGSDLDGWADVDDTVALTKSIKDKSIFKYLPKSLTDITVKGIVENQYLGYEKSDVVVYFPEGFNPEGDKVIRKLISKGVKYVSRYDISFEPLTGQSRDFKCPSETLVIFSGVRFLFGTFLNGDNRCSLGNDLIIEGIAKYFLVNPKICVHFVEKGADVPYAKKMCKDLGIENIVVWHKEMPFKKLISLYECSDICFDQMGGHWIGAIGAYSLWLGKPLIANVGVAVKLGIWPKDNPVCAASSPDEVYEWLSLLSDGKFRQKISISSKKFVEKYMGPTKTLNAIFDLEVNL